MKEPALGEARHGRHKIAYMAAAWVALAISLIAIAAMSPSDDPISMMEATSAGPASMAGRPMTPEEAEAQTASDHIDHSSLLNASDIPEANPAGLSIAAYERTTE